MVNNTNGVEAANTHDLHAVRLQKLKALREQDNDPFRANWEQTHTSQQALALLPEDSEEGPEVSIAGRIMVMRVMGKASFVKIQDRTGLLQLYVTRDELGAEVYNGHFKKLDL